MSHTRKSDNDSPWFPCGQPEPLILASASPRRYELLTQLGLRFETRICATDESWPDDCDAEHAAGAVALRKAAAVASDTSGGIILGADTVVMLDGLALGKPRDDSDALDMLTRLAGRAHRVITGIAIIDQVSGTQIVESEATVVYMRHAGTEELRAYVASGEPADKAGAYGIQGLGAGLITRIEGDYTNVVGLPIARIIRCLQHITMSRNAGR